MSAPSEAEAFFADDDQGQPEPAEWTRVEIPGDIPRGRGGRPKVRRLLSDGREDPTTLVDYTRASKLGETLEDHYAIHAREVRMVVHTMGHDPGLRARAQSVPTHGPDRDNPDHQRDRRTLREIHETALVVCRANTGADRGTALHALTEQYDQGRYLDGLDDDLAIGLARYAELIAGFEVVASETAVICDELEAMGSFDRVVTPRWPMDGPNGTVFEPGDRIVLDVKTNAEAKYFGPQYAVQQAVYAHGRPYSHEAGRMDWCDVVTSESLRSPRTDWSLILHIPIETPEDAGLWWVDLEAGMELARLAALARKVRRRAGMFLPAEPPTPPPGATATVHYLDEARTVLCAGCQSCIVLTEEDLAEMDAQVDADIEVNARRERTILGLIQATRSHADLVKVWERYAADGWTPACTAAADKHLVTLRVTS